MAGRGRDAGAADGAPRRLVLGHLMHVPGDPFAGAALEAIADGALLLEGERVREIGTAERLRAAHPDAELIDHRGAWLLPGFVDGHVHFPQLPVMGALGMRLLDWLRERALPHEACFSDSGLARREARAFLAALARNGTTTALVFGAHQAAAMEAFFEEAERSRLRVAAGLNLSDRELLPALHTDAERAARESSRLLERWHGRGRLRYAVTPRFALSASDAILAVCGELMGHGDGLLFTTHLNETPEEIAVVRRHFPRARDYLDAYERHALVGPRSVFAHDVHPSERELARLREARAVVCHCAGSNQFIGSGLFPMRRHRAHGVRLMLGTDVGGGPGFGMLAEARTAYQTQMLCGDEAEPLDAPRLLWLVTGGGAAALGLGDEIGDFRSGKAADLVVLAPPAGSTLAERLRHARGPEDALAALIVLAGEHDVREVRVAGEVVARG